MIPLKAILFVAAVHGVLGEPPKKIVGGSYSVADEFPYQVSLRMNGMHFCGGSIISTRHILTAAHCFDQFLYNYNQIVVVSGTTNLQYGGTANAVLKIKRHPSFMNTPTYMYPNDVAVVTLATPIQMDEHHHIIKLATKSDYGGMTGVVSGWGKTSENSNQPFPYLLKLKTNLINATYCQYRLRQQVYMSQICALASYNSGTCQGDSGGPLAVDNELVGIVSFGFQCAIGLPDVYTSVYYYKKFIEEAVNESGLSKDILYPQNRKYISNNENKIVNKVTNPTSPSGTVVPTVPKSNKTYYIFSNGVWYQVIYP